MGNKRKIHKNQVKNRKINISYYKYFSVSRETSNILRNYIWFRIGRLLSHRLFDFVCWCIYYSVNKYVFMFHVKHGCEIMIYGDVIQKLIMNESIIDDNKLNLAFYKLTEWILVLSEVT